MKGSLFAIHRFSVHDGPGIRTTVFLKGCPLRCLWCHNPESLDAGTEIAFLPHLCGRCGACAEACRRSAHRVADGSHDFDRAACVKCGACAEACVFRALEKTGGESGVDEVVREAVRDRVFYEESGGGVTVSGGEPLAQWRFTMALLSALKAEGLHTAVETSGFGPRRALEAWRPAVDLFLYDLKAVDPEKHLKCTGVPNHAILANLDFLLGRGARVELRCPLVPGLNDSDGDLAGLAALEDRYPSLAGITLLPYHNTGNAKYERYSRPNPLPGLASASDADRARWAAFFRGAKSRKVRL